MPVYKGNLHKKYYLFKDINSHFAIVSHIKLAKLFDLGGQKLRTGDVVKASFLDWEKKPKVFQILLKGSKSECKTAKVVEQERQVLLQRYEVKEKKVKKGELGNDEDDKEKGDDKGIESMPSTNSSQPADVKENQREETERKEQSASTTNSYQTDPKLLAVLHEIAENCRITNILFKNIFENLAKAITILENDKVIPSTSKRVQSKHDTK